MPRAAARRPANRMFDMTDVQRICYVDKFYTNNLSNKSYNSHEKLL